VKCRLCLFRLEVAGSHIASDIRFYLQRRNCYNVLGKRAGQASEPVKILYNVFHHHPGQPITLVSSRQDYLLPHQYDMSQQQNAQLSNREGRIQLACSAYTTRQFRSLRRAAKVFDVPRSTLTSRYNRITHILKRHNSRQKLTATE
jgi:hypothetical protein